MCNVLPALHNLTVSDTSTKIGTKYVALKTNSTFYLEEFGKVYLIVKTPHLYIEEYLVKVFNSTMRFKTMDLLHYYKYHLSKNI